MSANILDGKVYSKMIKKEVQKGVEDLKRNTGVMPSLSVLIVGDNPASKVYVRNKHNTCEELGIKSEIVALPENVSDEVLIEKIESLNNDENVHGILLQLPLPAHLKSREQDILNRIAPIKDVDGFHPINVGNLVLGNPTLVPCTPAGIMKMLDFSKIEIEGKRAVIIGRSNIVGKPLFHLLMSKNATVTVCHSRTKDLPDVCREADILVAAIGKPNFVTADFVKPGAIVIDVGINRIAPKKLVGDVDFDSVKEIASQITPVPGGVGLLTVATLMQNVLIATKLQINYK